jgi:hypothetical protein
MSLCVSYLVQWTVTYSVQLRMMYGGFPEYVAMCLISSTVDSYV